MGMVRVLGVRVALLVAALAISGFGFTAAASASSVAVSELRLYNGSTQVSPASAPAGSQRGFWLQIKYTNGLAAGQQVTIRGPVGATFSSSASDYLFHVSGGTPAPSAASLIDGGRGVVLTLPSGSNPITANDTRYLTFGGGYPNVSKTGVGTTKGTATMTVSTTNDTDPATTPSYEITPGPVAAIGVPGGGGVSATVGTNFSNSGQAIGAYDAYGNGIPDQQVNLTTPASGPSGTFDGNVRTTSVTMGSSGQALIPTTTAGTVAGSWNMTASAPGGSPSNTIPRTNLVGVAQNISIGLNPTAIVANGTSQTTATVTVSDAYGNRRSADDVRIGAIAGGPTIGTVTAQGNGVYTAPVTSSTTAGSYSITATDRTPPTPIGANPATLTQTAGPLHHIGVPASAVATTVGTAFPAGGQGIAAFDQFNNPIPSQQLTVSTPETGAGGTFAGGLHSTTVTTNSVGQVAVPATTANTVAGSWQMTASGAGGTPSSTFIRTNLAGGPEEVSLSLDPVEIPADGTAQTTATAEVTDTYGNPVAGQDVNFEASGGQALGAVTDHEDGSFSVAITSTTVPGDSTVTATDSAPVTPIVSEPATLKQTVLPATSVAVTLDPATILADGAAKTTATVSVTNVLGDPVPGEDVAVTTDGGQLVGAVTDNGNGTYTAELTASTMAGSSKVTATDRSPSTPVVGHATLTQESVTPPPPTIVKPVLRFVKPPAKKVRSAQVRFRFKVIKGRAASFQCKLDKKKWVRCKSPAKVKLKRGKHVFQVRGIAIDGTPGKPVRRVVRRTR